MPPQLVTSLGGFNPPPISTRHKPKSIFKFILTLERFQRGIIALIDLLKETGWMMSNNGEK